MKADMADMSLQLNRIEIQPPNHHGKNLQETFRNNKRWQYPGFHDSEIMKY